MNALNNAKFSNGKPMHSCDILTIVAKYRNEYDVYIIKLKVFLKDFCYLTAC